LPWSLLPQSWKKTASICVSISGSSEIAALKIANAQVTGSPSRG
jgi:hypothetical protein